MEMRPGKTANPIHAADFTTLIQGCLLAILMLLAAPAWAEAPYVAGKFTFSDGVVVTATELEMDGVIARTGVMCWLDLSDGKKVWLTRPKQSLSCVVRTHESMAEIYWYRSDALPIANKVERFDGYTFTDITTPARRWLSPLIHTGNHWLSYVVTIGLFIVPLRLGRRILQGSAETGPRRFLRVVWIVIGSLIAAVYSLVMTMYSAISPPIFLVLLGLSVLAYWQIRKRSQH